MPPGDRGERQAIAVPFLPFPTDLTSFLDLIRQHGDAAYCFIFAYAASHSFLLALFAGYAAQSGALSFGTLIAICWLGSFTGDVIRFWIGRAIWDPVARVLAAVGARCWVCSPTG
jgi:membrane protein DedA with SNARE-associated domain